MSTATGGPRVEAEGNSRRENLTAQSARVNQGATQADSAAARSDPALTHLPPSNYSCRRKQRFDCADWAEIRVPFAARPETGKILNLSLGECYVEAEFPFEVGTQLEIVLHVNNLSFARSAASPSPAAREVHEETMKHAGMGIQFRNITVGALGRLEELIAKFEENARG